jgi:hypothetical protein
MHSPLITTAALSEFRLGTPLLAALQAQQAPVLIRKFLLNIPH